MSELTWRQQRARIEILEYGIERLRGLLARIDNCDAITIDRDFPQTNVDEAEAIWDDIHAALAGAAVQPSAALTPIGIKPACAHEWFRLSSWTLGQSRCYHCGAWNTTPAPTTACSELVTP